jgi:hypothetical protein
LDERIFMPLIWPGSVIGLFGVQRAHVQVGEAQLDVLHFVGGVLAVPGVQSGRAGAGLVDEEGQLARGNHREAAGLVTRVHPGHVGNAVARHVVVVGGLAQLLRGKESDLDGALGRGFHRLGPGLKAGLGQRVRAGQPVRELQFNGLVLGLRTQGAGGERGHGGGANGKGETGSHGTVSFRYGK